MKKRILISMLLLSITSFNFASINPRGLDDKRVQIVNYSPSNVINIKCHIGKATMIELENGEEIKNYAFGDSEAWHFIKNKNLIIIKPKIAQPNTNLLVKTNRRVYLFDLSASSRAVPTYYLKFNYNGADYSNNYYNQNKYIYKKQGELINYNYWGYGDKELTPKSIYDDGLFTFINFTNLSDLPTVYKIMTDGTEAMVQFHMENGVMVVHELAQEFYIRLGKKVLGIKNKNFKKVKSTYNDSGTSNNNFRARNLRK